MKPASARPCDIVANCLLFACLTWGAGCPGDNGSILPDGSTTPQDGLSDTTAEHSPGSCPGTPCSPPLICFDGSCVNPLGSCASDEECLSDSFCFSGQCIAYGDQTKTMDPSCHHEGFLAEELKPPQIKCQWTTSNVRTTPVVADLNGDQQPEIIFIDFSANIVAIRGDTCQEVFRRPGGLNLQAQLAVADLTGDNVPEIIGADNSNRVVVFDNAGNTIATAGAAALAGQGPYICSGPAVADLDGQLSPEIVYTGMALRLEGSSLHTLYNLSLPKGHLGLLSTVADVNLDGQPELVTGNRILNGQSGADLTPAAVAGWPGGYVAVAQFDTSTAEPEVALISSQQGTNGTIRIYHPVSGALVFGPYSLGCAWGGPPTVADFDGDGQPEVGVAGTNVYVVFDLECDQDPLPSFCQAPGIRWSKTAQDFSSGATGSSVFDFNGDGKAEVVYRDECWLRVYDGSTGKVYFAHSLTSATGMEMPVIADVDNDGAADIIVSSETMNGCQQEAELGLPHAGPSQGVFVLNDPENRWMPSRPIWNQHAYHITNIEDDGTVPLPEVNGWKEWNSFRQNVQGLIEEDIPQVDLTARWHEEIDEGTECTAQWVLQADICNRGTATAPAGIAGTFYEGDPAAGGPAICSATTQKTLAPGDCDLVRCTWNNPEQNAFDLWFVADDSAGQAAQQECKEKNNGFIMGAITCPGTID